MKLRARFVTSAVNLAGCPNWPAVEVAIAGRSNVGKSSLINAVTRVKGLARTSKTPGRTRSLNFFSLSDALALVDLPGYGYARMSQAQARSVGAMVREYLRGRRNLTALVMLVDARRGPEQEELELAAQARARNLALVVIATKCDKLKRSQRAAAAARFKPLEIEPLFCSAHDGEGVEDLRRRIFAFARSAERAPIGPQ
jgi:GTP-binding protein